MYPNNLLQIDLTDYGPTKGNNKYKNTIRRSGPYTVFATKIDVVDNGTGGGTEGWLLNKTVTTTEAGINMTVNVSIDGSGQADKITVVKPGSSYLLQDKITVVGTGTTDPVIGIVSETTPEKGLLYDREKHSFKFTEEDIKRSEILKYIITKLQKK